METQDGLRNPRETCFVVLSGLISHMHTHQPSLKFRSYKLLNRISTLGRKHAFTILDVSQFVLFDFQVLCLSSYYIY